MEKRKAAKVAPDAGPGKALRAGDADDVGGADDAGVGAGIAVRLLVRDLRALEKREQPALDSETGTLVALYARTLSAIEGQQAKRGRGDMSEKTTAELLEMAMQVPELREALAKR
jgi:hypothetical protein